MPRRAFPLDNILELVQSYNGRCTWDFGQAMPLDFISGPTGSGICLSLSCHWIKYHAQDGSLVLKLGGYMKNRTYVAFNHNEYQRIANWQRKIENFPDWEMAYRAWLRNNQLRILSEATAPMNSAAIKPELRKINGAYALIILKSANVESSHAVAAYIGGHNEDACFFDPNYGEFWFENREDFFFFFHLFSNFFYHKNHHSNLGLDTYEIVRIWK